MRGLNDFARKGGTVVFVGVPWGLRPVEVEKRDGRRGDVFGRLFGLDWQVGEKRETICKRHASSGAPSFEAKVVGMGGPFVDINVRGDGGEGKAVGCYRVFNHRTGFSEDAACGVVWEGVGEGWMAYFGEGDLGREDAVDILAGLCEGV